MKKHSVTETEIETYYENLKKYTASVGLFLNPDGSFTRELIRGLLVNTGRYGYQSCPCRLASGVRERDRDIICPCVYRDPDVQEYGACYCALYVSEDIYAGKAALVRVPERRKPLNSAD